MLNNEQQQTYDGAVADIAEMPGASAQRMASAELIQDLGEPTGMTVASVIADVKAQSSYETVTLSHEEREAEFRRVSELPVDQWKAEIAALKQKLGTGWSATSIRESVCDCLPQMSDDELSEAYAEISILTEGPREEAIEALVERARRHGRKINKAGVKREVKKILSSLRQQEEERAAEEQGATIKTWENGNYAQVADMLIAEQYTRAEKAGDTLTIRFVFGLWHVWKGYCWTALSPKAETLAADVRNWLEGTHTISPPRGGNPTRVDPCRPTISMINEVIEAMKARALWDVESLSRDQLWIGEPVTKGPLMVVENGILDVLRGKLHDHTPRYFNLSYIRACWDGDVEIEGTTWGQFLDDIGEGDEEQIGLLQEFFGYSLTDETKFHKGLALSGVRRSGKGTLLRAIGNMCGPRSVKEVPMSSFGKDFALMGAEIATVISMPDVRVTKETPFGAIAGTILSATGEDEVTVNRKNISPWQGRLTAKWWALSNSPLDLRDSDGVLASRWMYIHLRNSFFEREDPELEAKIKGELDVVLAWAVNGLQRAWKKGHLTATKTHRTMLARAETAQDPVGEFVERYLLVIGDQRHNGETVTGSHREKKDLLFAAFWFYCKENGIAWDRKVTFFKKLNKAVAKVLNDPEDARKVRAGSTGKFPNQIKIQYGVRFRENMTPNWREMSDFYDAMIGEDDAVTPETAEKVIEGMKAETGEENVVPMKKGNGEIPPGKRAKGSELEESGDNAQSVDHEGPEN